MNIYVLTENSYLFLGVANSLKQRMDCRCVQLNPNSKSNSEIFHLTKPGDIVLVAQENSNIDFTMLMELNETNASVIIAANHVDWKISSIFRFATIARKFYLSDLLQNMYLVQAINNKEIKLPKITKTERAVLKLVMNGMTINFISSRLNITTKTAYSHQRSAFRKIGIRKSLDIIKLPSNYLNYLCSAC